MIVEEFASIYVCICNIEQAFRNDAEFDGIRKCLPSGQRYMLKLFDTTIHQKYAHREPYIRRQLVDHTTETQKFHMFDYVSVFVLFTV